MPAGLHELVPGVRLDQHVEIILGVEGRLLAGAIEAGRARILATMSWQRIMADTIERVYRPLESWVLP